MNEVTFGSLIAHLRMKAGCQGKRHVIGELDISEPAPNSQGGEKGEGMGWGGCPRDTGWRKAETLADSGSKI